MTAKKCILDNGSIPVVSRAHQAAVEFLGTPVKSALDMSKDTVARLKETANAIKFTWVLADRLKELGFNQAEKINDYLKNQRSYRESLMRHAEDVIHPFSQLHARNKTAALKVDEIGSVATLTEINPFMPRTRYETKKDLVEIDGVSMTQAEAWDALNKDLEALKEMDPQAPQVLKNVFDSYRFYRRELLRAIIQSYKDREGEGKLADDEVSPKTYELIQKTKEMFAQNDNDAYLTLMRSGKYVVNVYRPTSDLNEDGTVKNKLVESRFFESPSEADEFAQKARQDVGDPSLVTEFKKTDLEKYMYGSVNRNAVNAFFDKVKPELEKSLKPDEFSTPEEVERYKKVMDTVHDAALLLYPETSVRRNLVAKRKGTEGFIRDTLQVYARQADRYSSQIARIKYNAALDTELKDMQEQLAKEKDPQKQRTAADLITELGARVLAVEGAPTFGSRFANSVNQLGFLWYLGLNPASAIVNMLQVPGVTLPWLSARFEGQPNNLKELTLAYATLGKLGGKFFTEGSLSERLTDLLKLSDAELRAQHGGKIKIAGVEFDFSLTRDEVEMLRDLDGLGALRSGMQIYDINSLADLGGEYSGSFGHAKYVFNKMAGFMFQKAELVNREVTALAAYRLARKKAMIGKDKPLSKEEAVRFAERAIDQSQGAYAEDQAPRMYMNSAVRVILMFKKFPMHMATIYIQMFKDMLGPDVDPDVRRIAKRQFTLMMAMTGIMAGVAGMPLYYLIRDTANVVLGDEDEPYSFDLEFRKALMEQFGDEAGNMMYRGVLGETGLDIGSRISYESSFLLGGTDKLPFLGGVLGLRDIRRGDTAQETARNAMVEALGAGAGIVDGVFRGYDQFKQGEVIRGVEAMSPAFLRNMIKSGRFATEGALTARGDPIVEDLSTLEIMGQFFGFAPQRLSSQYKINNEIKDIEYEIRDRRDRLMDQYAKAIRTKDRATQKDVMEEIQQFNKANPVKGLTITPDSLRRSLAKRETVSQQTERGIFLSPSFRERLREFEGVEDV
jgi:hypothetical protein